jgi:hypothetical protein
MVRWWEDTEGMGSNYEDDKITTTITIRTIIITATTTITVQTRALLIS